MLPIVVSQSPSSLTVERLPQVVVRALDDAEDAMYVVGGDQQIASWNRAAELMFGRSATSVLRRRCHEVVAGTVAGCSWCRPDCPVWSAACRGHRVPSFDMLTWTVNGQPLWVSVGILVMRPRCGLLVVHMLRDVSAPKRLERLGAHVVEIVETSGVLLVGRHVPPTDLDQVHGAPGAGRARLTRRQLEVIRFLSHGLATPTIADRMSVSVHTVRNHVKQALRRTGLHSRSEMVAFAIRNGLA